ncbi:MAG: arylformamidase [Chloroflexi bacterium RBG_13_48_17]|nr:MAG: arylformamidase [Chloroflexi bacterium RBG_13_48_17]
MEMKRWIDITVPLRHAMVHWPGDPPVEIVRIRDLDRGDGNTISQINMGSHTGTHMDAPAHFLRRGIGIDKMPLDATVGRARVIEILDAESIKPEELIGHKIRRGERILFKTCHAARVWQTNEFVKDFVFISAEAADFLVERGVKAVGVDYLSVGGFKRDGSRVHRTLLRGGIWIIEGLDLSRVRPGRYNLICLPLKIDRGDGAPARAILRPV